MARSHWFLAAGAVAVAGGATAVVVAGDSSTSDAAEEPTTLRAVQAEERDLIEYTTLTGSMTYATSTPVTAMADGTITAAVSDGDTVARGDVLYELNAQPVTVFYGDLPLYRPLAEGGEGEDVAILEANLAALGYHLDTDDDTDPEDLADDEAEFDTGFTVDGVFDAATADAVRRWQDDLGVDDTGVVNPTDVVVVDGPATASAVAIERGDSVRAGAALLTLNVDGAVVTFHSQHTGESELIAAAGEVANGDVLYTIDDEPVAALLTDDEDLALDRNLFNGAADGDDVEALEQLLADLGYDADGDLDVDGTFDSATTEAVEEWQEDLADEWEDVDIDGEVRPADLAVVATGTTLGEPVERTSDTVATGSVLYRATESEGTRIVTTAIEVADQSTMAEGDVVDVEFPDGAVVAGTVTHLATTSSVDPTDPNAEPQLAVEVTLSEVPAEAERFSELDVEVLLVDELTAGATVVPASALVATADGGYAVEVVEDATTGVTSLVAVEPGSFTDGFVAVTGIAPGTAVVVPS